MTGHRFRIDSPEFRQELSGETLKFRFVVIFGVRDFPYVFPIGSLWAALPDGSLLALTGAPNSH